MSSTEQSLARPTSLTELFVAFTLLALQGFGGVLAASQRMLCESKRWLSQEEFVELLATSHVLPGPNVCNLALLVGDRFFGWRGAFTALAGMFMVPLAIVLGLTVVYAHYALQPAVAGALRGMGSVTAGLFIGTGLSLMKTLKNNAMRGPVCALVGAATFVAVALFHWPAWISLGFGAAASLYAWIRIGKPAAPEGSHS